MIAGIVASHRHQSVTPPSDLDGIFPNKTLGVLFYKGEKHPGGGGGSDTEWTLAPGDGIQMPAGTPYPGVIGQINYNLGPFILFAGDGPIEMASGYYFHYLVQSGSVGQFIISNKQELSGDNALDPGTKDEFNTWWDSKGRQRLELLDSTGAVVASVNMSIPTNATPEDGETATEPDQNRGAFLGGLPWAEPGDIAKARLVPITPA